ncbi:hypothetical protein [Hymenobacter canadensis]|uniref:Uncharacterized protein n=1 Tax=Hymenobacter canadensis TaxID=2999067 RepID=A0ABY7LRX2_9BACT|nr:hypothetical protein [Hymenobacter canadensis]WBA43159.1 hypothetical protein O3303_06240 [Hymenobacter canadensis]
METKDFTNDLLKLKAKMKPYVNYNIVELRMGVSAIFVLIPIQAITTAIEISEDVYRYLHAECADGKIESSMLQWY